MDRPNTLPPEWECFWRTDDGLTAVERAEANGIDLSLLDINLSLPVAERLRQNERALQEVEALRRAYLLADERTHPYHPPTG